MDAPILLWHFKYSPACEKARWALDYKEIGHFRRALIPGLHYRTMRRVSGQTSLPVLRLYDRMFADSPRILAELETFRPEYPLYPADPAATRRVLTLQDYFDAELISPVRVALFYALRHHWAYSVALLAAGSGPAMRLLLSAGYPAFQAAMTRTLDLSAEHAARSKQRIITVLQRIERELGPHGFLAGEHFSVADLTACALLYPFVQPPEHAYPMPGPLPGEAGELREEFARYPAFAWVARIYQVHRHTSHPSAVPAS